MIYIDAVVKLVGTPKLTEFKDKHPDSRSSIDAWTTEVSNAIWQSPQDIKNRYATASFLANSRVVFNIKGNGYRLLVRVAFETGVVLIERLGTHAEYDSWKL